MTRPKPQRTGATIAANEEANDSDSETVGSDRDSQADFDTPDQEHNDTEPEDRRVILNLRDNHDDGGEGMLVQMPWLGCFKNVFDHFKALSCSTCRTPGEMRFKTQTATVSDNTTPADLDLMHGTTTEITVYSNHPGMQCASCQSKGYPWTDGVDRTLYNKPAPPIDSTAPEPEYITVLLRDATGFEVAVKMLSSGHLGYAMEQYARTACREANLCRFLLEGERVTKTETPKQMGMDNENSRIEVHFEQIGG